MEPPHTSRRALARYIAGWFLTAAVVAALGLLAVRTISPDTRPLRRADPIAAVRDRCVLLRTRAAQRPPVGARASTPATAGVYSSSPSAAQLIGALRRGVVVVQYHSWLPRPQVDALRRAFGTASPPRILTPDATAMPYAVAGTAWGRLLGCRRFDSGVLIALERFARSYGGQGPDSRAK